MFVGWFTSTKAWMSHEQWKNPWLFRVFVGDEILHSSIGIISKNPYKDPYQTTSIMESKRVFSPWNGSHFRTWNGWLASMKSTARPFFRGELLASGRVYPHAQISEAGVQVWSLAVYIHMSLCCRGKKLMSFGWCGVWFWKFCLRKLTFKIETRWWFQVFLFHPYLGKWSILTSIFQMSWNHQLRNQVFWKNEAFYRHLHGSPAVAPLSTWFLQTYAVDFISQLSDANVERKTAMRWLQTKFCLGGILLFILGLARCRWQQKNRKSSSFYWVLVPYRWQNYHENCFFYNSYHFIYSFSHNHGS